MKPNPSFPNIESCKPLTCVSGKIMRCNRIIGNVFRKYLKPFGITDSQLSMLFMIAKAEKPTQKRLSDWLFMDKSSVNRNLNRLINRGYIEKLNIHDIQTTLKGKQLLEQVIPEWNKAMIEINTIIDDDGGLALNTLLTKLT